MLLAGFETISFGRSFFFFYADSAATAHKKLRRGVAKAARVDSPSKDGAPLALMMALVAVEAPMTVGEAIPYHTKRCYVTRRSQP